MSDADKRNAANGGMHYKRLVAAINKYDGWTKAQRDRMRAAAHWQGTWPSDSPARQIAQECFPSPMAFVEAVEALG